MKSIWSGAISFGLVNIPVDLYPSLAPQKIEFHLLHKSCHSRIGYQKHCPKCDRDLSWEEVVRAYEYERGKYVILEDEDFKKIDIKKTKMIEIQEFVGLEEIDPLYYSTSYYLSPKENAERAYFLLYEALRKTKRAGLAKFILKDKEHLALVRPYKNILILDTLIYEEEIVLPQTLEIKRVGIKKEELALAERLIESLKAKFEPDKYHNEYYEKLMKLIEKKIKGEKIVVEKEEIPKIKVKSLIEALKRSMKDLSKK